MDYLVMTVLSRLITYAIYQFGAEAKIKVDRKTMRERLCMDICRDVESTRGGQKWEYAIS